MSLCRNVRKTSKKEESDAKERERKFQGRKMGSQDNLTFVPLAVRRWWNTRFPDGPHVKNDNFVPVLHFTRAGLSDLCQACVLKL